MSTPAERRLSKPPVAAGAAIVMLASACGVNDNPPAPDFSGTWARYAFDFEPPPSGPGPVANMRLALPDGSTDLSASYGDYMNPILKAEAAAIVKQRGESSLSGVNFPDASNQCAPQAPPFLFAFQPGMQVLQRGDEIIFVYGFDNQVRRVRMNASHPVPVKPSAMGDSIGFFDGDTLVIDTIGIQLRAYSMVDRFGTPHSEDFHLVERYRLIDVAEAKSAAERQQKANGRRNGRLVVDPSAATGLQLQFTVEDPVYFTTPWSAQITFQRALPAPVDENICAENAVEHFPGELAAMPKAEMPDF